MDSFNQLIDVGIKFFQQDFPFQSLKGEVFSVPGFPGTVGGIVNEFLFHLFFFTAFFEKEGELITIFYRAIGAAVLFIVERGFKGSRGLFPLYGNLREQFPGKVSGEMMI